MRRLFSNNGPFLIPWYWRGSAVSSRKQVVQRIGILLFFVYHQVLLTQASRTPAGVGKYSLFKAPFFTQEAMGLGCRVAENFTIYSITCPIPLPPWIVQYSGPENPYRLQCRVPFERTAPTK